MNAIDRKTVLRAAALLSDYARELREGHVLFSTGRWPKGEEKVRARYEEQKAIAAELRLIAARK